MNKNHFLASTLMGGAFALAFFASCSNDKDLYDPEAAIKKKQAEYALAFERMFGQINPNCDWGFGTTTSTRVAYENMNMYEEKYKTPAVVSDEEAKQVVAWLRSHSGDNSIDVNWTDFSVQQVFKGTGDLYTYTDENGNTVVGTDHMDNLIDGTGTHIGDFNNGDFKKGSSGVGGRPYNPASGAFEGSNIITHYDKLCYMENASTASFGYTVSSDGTVHNVKNQDYKIHAIPYTINGVTKVGYYVCLNYVSFKQDENNHNQQVAGDKYFDDWVVKIVPADFFFTKRIMAEDLGTIDDFDFNDVVFDVAFTDGDWSTGTHRYKTAVITVQAAGGTLPLYIGEQKEANEVHNLLGVPAGTMVNTSGQHTKAPAMFRLNGLFQNEDDVKVIVEGTEATYVLDAKPGQAPQKLCVENDVDWSSERVSIKTTYPGFVDYVNRTKPVDWYRK